jgi:hypothetical protein
MNQQIRTSSPRQLDAPLTFLSSAVSRVRRNHALEHAAIHVLSKRLPGVRLIGRSSFWGYAIYGDAPTETVLEAAQEGLRQLRAGQREIAVHANCGTNLVVAGSLAGLGAFLALSAAWLDRSEDAADNRARRLLAWITRLPLACAAATLGLLVGQPLGRALQTHVTTQADVGDMRITGITREEKAGLDKQRPIIVHHVHTEDVKAAR